jgi:zinc protease
VKKPSRPERIDIGRVPVIVEPCSAVPLVSVTMATRTGASLDPIGQEGLSRVAARLSRRTAGGRPLLEIERELDRIGAHLGSDVSYSTSCLSATALTRSLTSVVDVMSQAVSHPSLDVEEFERLRRESRGELVESRDSDRNLCHRALRRTLFAGHDYGRSVGGTIQSLERLSHASLVAHHQATNCRDNVVLAFSGDLEVGQARAAAEQLLSTLPELPAPVDMVRDPEFPKGRHLVVVDKPERTQCQILIGLSGTRPDDSDHSALHVASTVFGGTFCSRLMQEVRAKRGWSYGAYATLAVDRCRHGLTLWTFPAAKDAVDCMALELDMLEALVKGGITKRELTAAKSTMVRSHAFSVDTAAKRASLELEVLTLGLPPDYYSLYEERIEAVTLDEANDALRTRLDPSALVVAVVGTASELTDVLAERLGPGTTKTVVPYDSDEL